MTTPNQIIMWKRHVFSAALNIALFFLLSGAPARANDDSCEYFFSELPWLKGVLTHITEDGARSQGRGLKVVMAAIELGKIKGLKTTDGKPVNISAGGVSAVMTDIADYYPWLLGSQKSGEIVFVSPLMDGIDRTQLTHLRNLRVKVEGRFWDIGVFEYYSLDGARYLFLDNPSFQRFTATPNSSVRGQTVYTMRGLEAWSVENQLEQQRVWSALNQAIAKVVRDEKAHVYVPHDSHMAPATFYLYQRFNTRLVSMKPLVHNEGYLGNYGVGDRREQIRNIWALESDLEMNEFFMQGDQLVMMAPAVRVAERNEIYTALSVSEGTANAINQSGHEWIQTMIDFFGRVGELTNGLGIENRPHASPLLSPGGTEAEIRADGIENPQVIKQFQEKGFRFSEMADIHGFLASKARAKEAIQRNFGMSIDSNKPLFISFARLVHQKGMGFIATNIEHILKSGGQVIIGGPVGDDVGERERQTFLQIKKKLEDQKNPNARNFVFIDGPVRGRVKGLVLAGGDFFLIPSRYEPCGLTDCEALYYGVIPIAHFTGGLSKGAMTLLYRPTNRDDQGWQVGEAINSAIALFKDRTTFEEMQWRATHQDFSVEKNFSKFLLNQRVEIYGKMLREVNRLVSSGDWTRGHAHIWILTHIMKPHEYDMPDLVRALKMLHSSRRNAMMNWLIETWEE